MAGKAGAKGHFVVGFGRANGDVEDGAGAFFDADRSDAHLRLVVVNAGACAKRARTGAVIQNRAGANGRTNDGAVGGVGEGYAEGVGAFKRGVHRGLHGEGLAGDALGKRQRAGFAGEVGGLGAVAT